MIYYIQRLLWNICIEDVQALESVFCIAIFPPPPSLLHLLFIFQFHLLVKFCCVQGVINVTSTYDSRTQEVEGSIAARGDLWRVEASRGGSTSGNENSSLFLVQLGPLLFIRDSTLLLPVHLSKQHLLWYGYDRKVNMKLRWLKCIFAIKLVNTRERGKYMSVKFVL